MTNCPTCGASLRPGHNRCIKCGNAIAPPPAPPAPPPGGAPPNQMPYNQPAPWGGWQQNPNDYTGVPTALTKRNKTVAAFLAFFLGTLGIHRFYVGRNLSGCVYLLISFFMLIFTLGLGLIFVQLAALLECIRFLFMSDEEFVRKYP